jgi:hypothetical protein
VRERTIPTERPPLVGKVNADATHMIIFTTCFSEWHSRNHRERERERENLNLIYNSKFYVSFSSFQLEFYQFFGMFAGSMSSSAFCNLYTAYLRILLRNYG